MFYDGHTVYRQKSGFAPSRFGDLEPAPETGSYYLPGDLPGDLPEGMDLDRLWITPAHFSFSENDWSVSREANFNTFSKEFGGLEGVCELDGVRELSDLFPGAGAIAISLAEYITNEEIRSTLSALMDYPVMDTGEAYFVREEAIEKAWNGYFICPEISTVLQDFEHPLCPVGKGILKAKVDLDLDDFFDEFHEEPAEDAPRDWHDPQLLVFNSVLKELGVRWEETRYGMVVSEQPGSGLTGIAMELAYRLTDGDFDHLLPARESDS